ncbi:SusC/RagA family TonB-linked outer membrane protein [Marinifilum sp. RC60d5]|uniref:SusC/RagA family TonB-linked outer membrane protein n=1 Tax=Marinifilum sp. RC60d5 TaxID=3458414 RepID=UPI004035942B
MQKRKEIFVLRLLFFFLLMCFTGLYVSAQSQEKKLELRMKSATLIQIMSAIKENTNYTFLYNVDDIKKLKGLKLNGTPKSVEDILTDCLSKSGLTYEIRNRLIIIKPISDLQTYKIKTFQSDRYVKKLRGRVTDANGVLLPGVSVLFKGTNFGTSTDINGNYSLLQHNNSNGILVFSFIGMKTREISIGDQEIVDAVLDYTDEKLLEVVVTTGYQKIDRKLFTGAASKIYQKQIELNGIPDASRFLQGHVAGMQIENISGTFGTAPIVRIRGNASVNGSNKPLWVVDGVVLEDIIELTNDDLTSGNLSTVLSSGLLGINPYDIESYQILKDASATALYGAKAMNGVIVITTKKGKRGKPTVSYSGSVSIKQKPSYSQFDVLTSDKEMEVYQELYDKDWIDISTAASASNRGALSKMFHLIANNELSWGPDGGLNYDFLSKYANSNTDWFDVLFRNSLSQQHSFGISGGSDHSRLFSSIGFYNDAGQTVSDKIKNYTASIKGDFDISEKFKLGFKLSGNIRDQQLPGSRDRKFEPITGVYERNFDINPFNYALYTGRSIRPYDDNGDLEYFRHDYAPFNILYELNHNYVNIDVDDFLFQGDLQYKVNSRLKVKSIFQGRWVNTLREQKIHESSNQAEVYRADNPLFVNSNKYLFDDPEAPEKDPYTVLPQGGFYNTTKNSLTSYFMRNIVEWSPKFSDEHITNFLIGQEVRYTNRSEIYKETWGYLYDKGGLVVSDPNFKRYLVFRDLDYFYDTDDRYRFIGAFATGSYSYLGKYIFNATFRFDGDNRQGKIAKSRYLPTWNFSLAWNLHAEKFMSKYSFIDLFKVKATYGLSGDNGIGASKSLVLRDYEPLRPNENDRESVLYIENLANKNLRWEKLYEFNFGFELGLINNRIYLDLEYYKRYSKDLLGLLTTSGIGGETYKYGNVGELKMDGFEATVFTKNINKEKFSWSTKFTFSYSKDKITEYSDEPRIADAIQSLGTNLKDYSAGSLFSIPFAGLDTNGVPQFYGPDGELTQKINLQNRLDILKYLKYEGPVTPRGFGGLNNTFSYNNFSLSVGIHFRYGNKIRLEDAYSDSYDDYSSLPGGLKDRWRSSGDENSTNIPAILSWQFSEQLSDAGLNPYQLYNKSDVRVADGGFVRLKDVSLDYQIPQNWLKNGFINSANLRFQAYNLALLYSDSKLNGIDPEYFQSGGISLPMARTYTFSVNLNF